MHGPSLTLTQGILTGSAGYYAGLPSCLGTSFSIPREARFLTSRQLYFDADSSRFHIHALR